MNLSLSQRFARHLKYYLIHGEHPLTLIQSQVVEDIIKDLELGNTCGYVKRPTGTGKTVIFCAILDALSSMVEEFIEDGSDGAIVLVDTVDGAEEVYKTLTKKKRRNSDAPLFGWSDDQVAIYYGSGKQASPRKQGEALGTPFVIMTTDAYRELEKSGKLSPQERPIAIIDEVDAAKGKLMSKVTRRLTARSSLALGFSATDKYLGHNGVIRIGPELFGRDAPIHETSPLQAAAQEEICPTRNILFITNLESGVEYKMRGKEREFTDQELEIIVNQPGRDDAIIKSVAEFVDPETNVAFKDLDQIWFCFGVKHAHRIADRLNFLYQQENGHRSNYPYGYAVAVSGQTPKDDWIDENGEKQLGLASILELHRQGAIPVLCNADLLIRSFDSPRTQLAVMARPFCSPAYTEQAGGRISRLDPLNLRKIGFVATFFDKDMEMALAYADVTGSAKLGVKPNVAYAAANSGRRPFLERLNPNQDVKVIVHWEPRVVEEFLAKRRAKRNAAKPEEFPARPDDYLTISEIESLGHLTFGQALRLRKILRRKLDDVRNRDDVTSLTVDGIKYEKDRIGFFRQDAKHWKVLAVHKSYLSQIEAHYGRTKILPVLPEDYITPNEMADMVGITKQQASSITGLIRIQYQSVIDQDDVTDFKALGITFKKSEVGFFYHPLKIGLRRFAIHKSYVPKIAAYYRELENRVKEQTQTAKPKDFMSPTDLADTTGMTKNQALSLMAKVRSAYKRIEGSPEVTEFVACGVTFDIKQVGIFISDRIKNTAVFAVHKQYAPQLAAFAAQEHTKNASLKSKPDDFLTVGEFAAKADIPRKKVAALYATIQRAISLSEPADAAVTVYDIKIDKDKCGIFRNTRRRPDVFAIHESYMEPLIKYYEARLVWEEDVRARKEAKLSKPKPAPSPAKPASHVTYAELAEKAQISKKDADSILGRIRKAYVAVKDDPAVTQFAVGGIVFDKGRVGFYQSVKFANMESFSIDECYADAVGNFYRGKAARIKAEKLETKPDDYCTIADLAKELEISLEYSGQIFIAIRGAYKKANKDTDATTFMAHNITFDINKAGMFVDPNRSNYVLFAISRDYIPQLRAYVEASKAKTERKQKAFVETGLTPMPANFVAESDIAERLNIEPRLVKSVVGLLERTLKKLAGSSEPIIINTVPFNRADVGIFESNKARHASALGVNEDCLPLIRQAIETAQSEFESKGLQVKPANFVGAAEVAQKLDLDYRQVLSFFQRIKKAYGQATEQNGTGETFLVGDITFERKNVGRFASATADRVEILAVHEIYLPEIERYFGARQQELVARSAGMKPDNFLTVSEFASRFGVGFKDAETAWHGLRTGHRKLLANPDLEDFTSMGIVFPADQVKEFESSKSLVLTVHENSATLIADYIRYKKLPRIKKKPNNCACG